MVAFWADNSVGNEHPAQHGEGDRGQDGAVQGGESVVRHGKSPWLMIWPVVAWHGGLHLPCQTGALVLMH
jgi:hypothetical protein